MVRLRIAVGLLSGILSLTAAAEEPQLSLSATDRILILAPHPDDETLCCSGIIQEAVAQHIPLKIVFLTYGDFNKWAFTLYSHSPVFRPKTMRAMGEVRRHEALEAAHVLGAQADALLFLGYPDYGTLAIWNAHWANDQAYESANTRVSSVPYSTAYRPSALYKGENILQDLEEILKDFRPTKVFAPHPADQNVDHRALAFFLKVALWDNEKQKIQAPALYSYLVHRPSHREETSRVHFPLNEIEVKTKYAALKKHRTEWVYSQGFLTSFVQSTEPFVPGPFKGLNQSKTLENWAVSSDSESLVVSGHLTKRQRAPQNITVVAFGYRSDAPFAEMPKFTASFVLAGHQQDFLIRIPRSALRDPDKAFLSAAVLKGHHAPTWDNWKIWER